MERNLVLQSNLTSDTWGLLEMYILLTDDIVEFNLPGRVLHTCKLRTNLISVIDMKLNCKTHQDLFLSLLIAKCPVSISFLKLSLIRNIH